MDWWINWWMHKWVYGGAPVHWHVMILWYVVNFQALHVAEGIIFVLSRKRMLFPAYTRFTCDFFFRWGKFLVADNEIYKRLCSSVGSLFIGLFLSIIERMEMLRRGGGEWGVECVWGLTAPAHPSVTILWPRVNCIFTGQISRELQKSFCLLPWKSQTNWSFQKRAIGSTALSFKRHGSIGQKFIGQWLLV